MKPLRLSLIQSTLYWEDPKMNRQQFAWKIRDLDGEADIIVLPEMFTTGFTMHPEKVAEFPDGPTTAWMQELAHESGAALTGSVVIRTDAGFVNRLLWVMPDGTVSTYDKRHLFALAGEDKAYHAGQDRLIVEWKEWRICPLICYDLRFPVWSRNTEDIHLYVYVANWPEPRHTHWQRLLCARAIENQAYVAGVNRIGRDENGHEYRGDSSVFDYRGDALAASAWSETTLSVTLDPVGLQSWRERLPFLEDRDGFRLNS